MATGKRPKPRARGARVPPKRPRTNDADRTSFTASLESAMNELLDEADRFAESIALALGLRGASRPRPERKRRTS